MRAAVSSAKSASIIREQAEDMFIDIIKNKVNSGFHLDACSRYMYCCKQCADILMHKDSQKSQAYPWICRGFLFRPGGNTQEISADQVENRSI